MDDNDMDKKIQLKEEHVQYLVKQPESGMGYQIVDIILKNGQLLKKRTILNANLLIVGREEKIDPNYIERIEIAN